MSSSGPDFVAVPASLLPVDSALVLMTSVDLRPPRLPETGEPELWRVVAGADLCEQMTPQAEATYLLKFLYKAPLLAARIRLELLRRRREYKVALWRKNAKENRSADGKRKRAAAAATAELQRTVRPRVAAAVGEAASSSSVAAAPAGGRGPDGNVASSSAAADAAPGLRRLLGALGAVILEPGAAAADDAEFDANPSSGEEAVPAEVFDDEEIDYWAALFGPDADTE